MTTPQEATGMSKDKPKTKEEILYDISAYSVGIYPNTPVWGRDAIKAMQVYADQQTAPLQSEIDRLQSELAKCHETIRDYEAILNSHGINAGETLKK